VNAPRCLTLRLPQDESNAVGSTGDNDCTVDASSLDLASVVSSVRRQQGAAILYPSAKVEADCFRLLSGQEQWKTYHAQVRRRPPLRQEDDDDGDDNDAVAVVVTKAYSFCRVCACHLLHASDDDAFSISINVHTLTTPWTSTLEEEAKDVYNHQDVEDDEEEADFTTARRHTASRFRSRKRQPKKNKPPPRRRQQQQQQQHQSRLPQQQHTSSTGYIVTPQQGDVADLADTSSSSYIIANNPSSAGVDWPMMDDDDHDHDDKDDHGENECNRYGGVDEEESTISSTTTTSSTPFRLDGTETTATTMSASTMMTQSSVVAEQQQRQQKRDAAAESANRNSPTSDLVTREKLRQYMAKHMMKKKNKTIAETSHNFQH
jgi:hypothetical protein